MLTKYKFFGIVFCALFSANLFAARLEVYRSENNSLVVTWLDDCKKIWKMDVEKKIVEPIMTLVRSHLSSPKNWNVFVEIKKDELGTYQDELAKVVHFHNFFSNWQISEKDDTFWFNKIKHELLGG